MDKKNSNYRRTEGSANDAVNRVRKDPDNSGRAGKTPGNAGGEGRRLARQQGARPQRPSDAPKRTSANMESDRMPRKPEGRHYIPKEEPEIIKPEIRINKKMRTWNKYKNFVIGGAALIVVIIIVAVAMKSCVSDVKEEQESMFSKPSMGALEVTQSETASAQEGSMQTQSQTASQSAAGSVLTTTRTVTAEDYTSESFYSKSLFLGDAIVNGMEYYKYLGSDNIVSDTNLTAVKAQDKVSSVAAKNPEKVYIMLGLNDLNYNSKTVDGITSDFQTLVSELRKLLPSSKIYIVSVTPVTKSCEDKKNMYITMSNIEALNNNLKSYATGSQDVYFVDVNSAFMDASGYLNEDVTPNGYTLKSGYYGFLLNTIAEMTR